MPVIIVMAGVVITTLLDRLERLGQQLLPALLSLSLSKNMFTGTLTLGFSLKSKAHQICAISGF
jgi:hypothetical protein